ncbi:uncharacterized protein RJT20DRAFT_129800 [Scheffersomyces xylosifermentans]|uniref:uncharacterized protein n=1 Tax=Scheffersomyces xylosifermentans TaxID=1304137 RepID=UPI00315CE294
MIHGISQDDSVLRSSCHSTTLHSYTENIDYLEYIPEKNGNHYLQDNSNLLTYLKYGKASTSASASLEQSEASQMLNQRLSNICWRRIYKNMYGLSEINPYYINWDKNSDITWLYGPKYANTTIEPEHTITMTETNWKLNCEDEVEDDGYYSSTSESSEVSSISFSDNDEQEDEDDDMSSIDSGYMSDYQSSSSIPALRKGSVGSTTSASTYYDDDEEYDYMSLKSILKKDEDDESYLYYNTLLTKKKMSKKVSFNFIVNTREIINGISFDYDFLDQDCL